MLEKGQCEICEKIDYDMKFSISSLVPSLDPYKPHSFALMLDMGVSG
jgi:hypothetical protein